MLILINYRQFNLMKNEGIDLSYIGRDTFNINIL